MFPLRPGFSGLAACAAAHAAPWAARGASASALGAMEAFLSLGNVAVADFLLGQDSSNSCLCFSLPQHSVDAFRR